MKFDYKVSVGVVLNNKNQILLGRCQSDDERNGMLCLPGGGIEGTEDVFSAALREVKEETNVTGAISQMVFTTHSGLPQLAFVVMKDTGENTELKFNDEYDPSNPGGWFDLKTLQTEEILNSNLDILKTLGLIKKEVSFHKNNESIQHLIEDNLEIESILEKIVYQSGGKRNGVETHGIKMELSESGHSQMLKILDHIKSIGNIGHSFTIDIDPDMDEHNAKFGWDGDGSDQIHEIEDLTR